MKLDADAELARRIAAAACDLLVSVRHCGLFEGRALGDVGDRVANAFIMEALKAARPDDAILCEEETDSAARLAASRVWIVDPLDGTREYREGRDDWAVHIGLVVDGAPAAGAVSVPNHATVCSGAPPRAPAPAERVRILVSRTRPPAIAHLVAERLDAEVLRMGSAGAKTMAIVRGEADVYVHTGDQNEWDNCAPVAVALAAGLHASRLDGTALVYNRRHTIVPDLLICRMEHASAVLALAAELGSAPIS